MEPSLEVYETLPIVPLRDVVVFPHMMMPFVIGRPSSTRALEHALMKDKRIFLAAQHDASVDDPRPDDVYTMGCVANVVQSLKLPDGNIKVLVEGVDRARAVEWKEDKGFFRVVVKVLPRQKETAGDVEATMSRVVSLFEQYVKLSNNLHYDAMIAAVRVDDPGKLADTIAAHLLVGVDEKQNLLEIISPLERLNRIAGILEIEVDKLHVDRRIQARVKKTRENRDLKHAETVLNEDHYGLEKIKDRILEFLAVRSLVKKPKATILTFSGPPGVGKTSLAKSIARAMNRKFVRLSLGGVRDEAEIRGHRRTYIGAFPGQIIQMMKKAGSMNPVFLLDEVDKMSMDFRGDPSAALLEVLDPEQNNAFLDHYLDVEYDLSNVMFICTANVLHTIPQALRDRMEVMQLAGYTEQEKIEIAKRFLAPKAVEGAGLTWTEVGGELLVSEATLMPGKGKLTLTGKLGDVMQESAQAALSYVRTRAPEIGLPEDFHSKIDIHVHVPEGAIPKDGPSAGITMATALVSALTKIPARRDVAMTGEITLRGKVLPIGGIKEKVLAAHRAGVKNIVLPRDNEKDLADIPKNVLDTLDLHLVSTMDEVLRIALTEPLPGRIPAAPVVSEVSDSTDRITH